MLIQTLSTITGEFFMLFFSNKKSTADKANISLTTVSINREKTKLNVD